MIGRTIVHYQVVGKLDEGGMGVVYKARDLHLDRFLALKLLPPERVADPEASLCPGSQGRIVAQSSEYRPYL
jgi:serine/threonine protein kinase